MMREFGKTGFKVSNMGIGTYYDPWWLLSAKLFGRRSKRELKLKAINAALDSGINLIDTAEIYGSEEIVGDALKGRDRENLFIATKVWPSHFSEDKIIRSCDRSLKRLNLKYIDLYQLHFPSRRIPIDQTMKAMEKLVDSGKIRNIGISNFNHEKMEEAISVMKKHPIISTQMPLNLINRKNEGEILPICKREGIAMLAYYPLGHGTLVSEAQFGGDVYSSIARNHEGISPAQVALNWFYNKFDNVFPIPRASNPKHVLDNAHSMTWKLSSDEMSILEKRFGGPQQ
jgi:diketogulonate reductase-like aldo/keto reductase